MNNSQWKINNESKTPAKIDEVNHRSNILERNFSNSRSVVSFFASGRIPEALFDREKKVYGPKNSD
jgi:hypothetical protein